MTQYHEMLKDAAKYCDINGVICDDALDAIYEEAYIQACENDSPNSYGFDAMVSRIDDNLRCELLKKVCPNA